MFARVLCEGRIAAFTTKYITMNITPRVLTALALTGTFACTSLSAAESGPYFRVGAGPVFVQDISVDRAFGVNVSGVKIQTEKTGFGFTAAGGLNLNENFALELETGMQHVGFRTLITPAGTLPLTGSASIVPILANTVFTAKLSETVAAYAGAGVGIAVTTAEIGAAGVSTTSETKTSFMGQLKTGLDFKLSDNASAGIGYHFGIVDGPSFSTLKTGTVLAHMFTVGVGFKF